MLRMLERTQARGIFPRAIGSSARIGVGPVVTGGPTARLADLVWYGTRWRRIRGAHGCNCVHGAAARMGRRSGTAASSCSAQTSRYRRVRND